MKKHLYTVLGVALAIAAGTSAISCGDTEDESSAPAKKEAKADASNLPNYRYVDLDTLLTKYILAKDYNEEMMRMQENLKARPSVIRLHCSRSPLRFRTRCRTIPTSRRKASTPISRNSLRCSQTRREP